MAFEIVLTPNFKKDLKQIAKKHKQILKDIGGLIDKLTENPTIGTGDIFVYRSLPCTSIGDDNWINLMTLPLTG